MSAGVTCFMDTSNSHLPWKPPEGKQRDATGHANKILSVREEKEDIVETNAELQALHACSDQPRIQDPPTSALRPPLWERWAKATSFRRLCRHSAQPLSDPVALLRDLCYIFSLKYPDRLMSWNMWLSASDIVLGSLWKTIDGGSRSPEAGPRGTLSWFSYVSISASCLWLHSGVGLCFMSMATQWPTTLCSEFWWTETKSKQTFPPLCY